MVTSKWFVLAAAVIWWPPLLPKARLSTALPSVSHLDGAVSTVICEEERRGDGRGDVWTDERVDKRVGGDEWREQG